MDRHDRLKLNIVLVFLLTAAVLFLVNPISKCLPTPAGISSFVYICIVIGWNVSAYERIPDRHVRRYILICSVLVMLIFVCRMCRWDVFCNIPAADHVMWYAFYITFTGVPLFSLFAAESIGAGEERRISKHSVILTVVWGFMCVLFLTNDFHHLLLTIGSDGTSTESYGILYIVHLIWTVSLFITGFVIVVRKCRRSAARKYFWAPLLMAAFGVFLIVWYFVEGGAPVVLGAKLYNLQEVFSIPFIAFCELCIMIGLVPSNAGYGSIFCASHIRAALTDLSGNVIVHSADYDPGELKPYEEDANMKLRMSEVPGGRISWNEDHSGINHLRNELEDVTLRLEEENDIIDEENRIAEMNAGYEAQNILYDRIAGLLGPQLDVIDHELKSFSGGDIRDMLARISLPGAYIKRRANLELLKYRSEIMSVSELYFSVREVLEYLNLIGPVGLVTRYGDCESAMADSNLIIAVYELIDEIISSGMGTMGALQMEIDVREGLKITVSTDDEHDRIKNIAAGKEDVFSRSGASVRTSFEDDTVYLVIIAPLSEGVSE